MQYKVLKISKFFVESASLPRYPSTYGRRITRILPKTTTSFYRRSKDVGCFAGEIKRSGEKSVY